MSDLYKPSNGGSDVEVCVSKEAGLVPLLNHRGAFASEPTGHVMAATGVSSRDEIAIDCFPITSYPETDQPTASERSAWQPGLA